MADSRALLRPAQLLALVKELREFEERPAVDPEAPVEGGHPQSVSEREHSSGSLLGG